MVVVSRSAFKCSGQSDRIVNLSGRNDKQLGKAFLAVIFRSSYSQLGSAQRLFQAAYHARRMQDDRSGVVKRKLLSSQRINSILCFARGQMRVHIFGDLEPLIRPFSINADSVIMEM